MIQVALKSQDRDTTCYTAITSHVLGRVFIENDKNRFKDSFTQGHVQGLVQAMYIKKQRDFLGIKGQNAHS